MRLLIWGAGAIGGTLGAYLARAGHTVTFVDTDEAHVNAIARNGLTITGPIAHFTVSDVDCFHVSSVQGAWDCIVIATKAQHTDVATRALVPHLTDDGCVVSAQNGLNELTIAEIVGAGRTVGAFVNFGADYTEPGIIHYGGRGAVVVGEIDGLITPRVEAIRDSWRDFDQRAIVTDNIWGYLWGKEAYGAMLFATALTNDSIADALASSEFRHLYVALAREILGVAVARGVSPQGFDGFDPLTFMPGVPDARAHESLDELVAHNRRSAKTHSGIWRDLAVRKRPTEVDAQLGIVVTLGRDVNVATPLTARLVALIHEVERGERTQSIDTLRLLAAASTTH